MAGFTFTPQKQVFNKINTSIPITVDISAVTLTDDNGNKYLPAGTPLGAGTDVTPISLRENPTQLAVPKNDAAAQVYLVEDLVFDGINDRAVKYATDNAEGMLKEANAACQKVFTADLAATAKAATPLVQWKVV